jgi:putative DNA primase/helicase
VASAAYLARQIDARRRGQYYRSPCLLGCGYEFALWDGEDGGIAARCFGGCGYADIMAALVPYGLLDSDDDIVCHDVSPSVRPTTADDLQRAETACSIYDGLAPAVGSIAETYLRECRRITIDLPSGLKSGLCPHRIGGTYPAMVAPYVNIDGEQTGYHATFLRPDGSGKADFRNPKWQRECRGPMRGCVIRLSPHDHTRPLLVGEGVENTLSAMQLFDLPGWSAIYAGGLGDLELPPAVREVFIAADNDVSGCGQRVAWTAHQRWSAEGRSVRIVMPPTPGDDFNDVLRRG